MKKSNKMITWNEKKVEKKSLRKFYFPELWRTIEAESIEKATELARKK